MSYNKMNFQNMSQEEWKEAFINDALSPKDRAFFQNLIDANPELKDEIQLEEGLRDAIFEARKKELKAHLNTLDIETSNTIFNVPRTALVGSLLVAGVMTSMLTYFDVYKEYHTFFKPKSYTQQITQTNTLPTTQNNHKESSENIDEVRNDIQNNPSQDDVEIQIKVGVKNAQENYMQAQTNTPTKNEDTNTLDTPNSNELAKQKSYTKLSISEPLDINLSAVNHSQNKKLHTLLNIKPRSESQAQEKEIKLEPINNNLTYQTNKQDDDLGIFDGKRNTTLENDLKGHKLFYQYYGNKLFVYSANVRGKELHLDEKTGKRHFLYYDKQFYEFFDNQMEKAELKPVTQSELIDRLKKELLNR